MTGKEKNVYELLPKGVGKKGEICDCSLEMNCSKFRTDYRKRIALTKTRFPMQEPGIFSGKCFRMAYEFENEPA